jgi:hypothetical protein
VAFKFQYWLMLYFKLYCMDTSAFELKQIMFAFTYCRLSYLPLGFLGVANFEYLQLSTLRKLENKLWLHHTNKFNLSLYHLFQLIPPTGTHDHHRHQLVLAQPNLQWTARCSWTPEMPHPL